MTSYIADIVLIIGIIFILYFLIRIAIVRPKKLRFSLFWLLSGFFFILCAIAQKSCPCTLLNILCMMILIFCAIAIIGMVTILIIASHEKAKALALRCRYAILLGVHYPSEEFRIRSEAAWQYWQAHPDCSIICSGGRGSDEDCSEAAAYHKYLEEHGVPHDKLLIEDHSTGTMENLCNSLSLMHTGCVPSDASRNGGLNDHAGIAIITSDYHALRTLIIARKCGIKNVAVYPAYYRTISWPNYSLRELFALIPLLARSSHH